MCPIEAAARAAEVDSYLPGEDSATEDLLLELLESLKGDGV